MNDNQQINREILAAISISVESNPDWRFHELLQKIGVNIQGDLQERGKDGLTRYCKDLYYEESSETLDRIKNSKSR